MKNVKVLGNEYQGLLFIISAPAGTGKTTLVQMLTQEFSCIVKSISFTTRQPRSGEIDGVHYHFITESEFEKKIRDHEFLEYVKLYGYYYGTSKKWVQEQQEKGNHVILVIDTQGGLQMRNVMPAIFIFLEPPSLEELSSRLKKRKTEDPQVIEERLAWSKREIEDGKSYDYKIVNDDLKIAYEVLKSIVIAEEHRILPTRLS